MSVGHSRPDPVFGPPKPEKGEPENRTCEAVVQKAVAPDDKGHIKENRLRRFFVKFGGAESQPVR